MKKVFLFFTMLMTVCCMAGCKGGKGDTINIGVIGPHTGNLSVYGLAVERGVEIAVEEINANGGILGKQVKLFVEDDQGDSQEVLSAYNKIVDDVDFIIGEVTSGNSDVLAAQAQADEIPTISASATAANVTANRDYVFRTCFLDPDQGEAMAKFAKSTLNATTVAIVYDQSDDYSKGVAEAFKTRAEAEGMTVVLTEGGLVAGEATYQTIVNTVVSTNPDCVFAPIYYTEAAVFAKELRTSGYTKPLMGSDGFDGVLNQLLASDYSCVNNTYYSTHYSTEDSAVQAFIQKYEAKYGEKPAAFALLGYDTVYLVAQAIENAGTVEKTAIKEAIQNISFTGGLTGNITFDKDGNPIKTICICEYVNGESKLKEKITK